jgi:hypothetical protein
MNRKPITIFDVCLILLIVVITFFSILFYFSSDVGKTVLITVDETTVMELSLTNNQTKRIETDNGYNLIVIQNGKCTVKEADCRDEICVNHTAISKVGQSIVCLPHKLIVEIK